MTKKIIVVVYGLHTVFAEAWVSACQILEEVDHRARRTRGRQQFADPVKGRIQIRDFRQNGAIRGACGQAVFVCSRHQVRHSLIADNLQAVKAGRTTGRGRTNRPPVPQSGRRLNSSEFIADGFVSMISQFC